MRLPALPQHILLLAAAVPLLGCPNTDAAIFVAPTISDPAATVTALTVGGVPNGTGISASKFTLDLHLGARASGPSQVTLGEFSIMDASQSKNIVSPLIVSADVSFPVMVQPDSTVTAHFTFDTTTKPLPAAAHDDLCAGEVVIVGAVDDALAGRSDPVSSAGFSPTCK